MATLQDFQNTLNEVVKAKRLSASKMNKLTEIAMKSLEDDTKLVAMLYRTHKSLPSSAKVSSLYAFDALARAARSTVNKHGITGDINSERGNAATFLLKMEGVLDGLIQDMVFLDNTEAKDKTKKVLDIWVKSTTFPSAVLTRLRDILSDVRKAIFSGISASNEMRVSTETQFGLLFPLENTASSTPPVDPRVANEAPAAITPPQPATNTPTTTPDVQATLLALLGQAAQITGQSEPPPSQTPPNTDPQLGPNQLALLQQLALTAKLTNGAPTPPPGQTSSGVPMNGNVAPPAIVPHGPPRPYSGLPGAGVSRSDPPVDPRYGRNGYADRPRDRPADRDDRPPRGGFRGGYHDRGRWDDRSRPHNRDWDPHSRQRHSRSRSPRRHEERRNVRAYSPPHRPPVEPDSHPQPKMPTPPTQANDTDEFGRDITGRPSSLSPPRSTSVEDTHTLAPMDSSVVPTPAAASDYHIPVSDQLPLVAASTSAQSTETHTPGSASQRQQPGLDQFDITTFDATAPSSWEALGNMWQTTYGYTPSQEELMQFVITRTMAAAGMPNEAVGGAQGGQWQQGSWEGQDPRRNGGWQGGRGGYTGGGYGGHGNYRNGGGYTNAMEESDQSYAVVLNGDDDETNSSSTPQNPPDVKNGLHDSTPTTGTTGGGMGGRMQRVGDKWMFVRNAESGASSA